MTDFVEGAVHEIRPWTGGGGADVLMHDDKNTYYYEGKMNILLGAPCKMEVKQGTGEHSDKWEILNYKPLIANPTVKIPITGSPAMENMKRRKEVRMDAEAFEQMMKAKTSLKEVKVRSMDFAIRIYTAMHKFEKDTKAAAHEIIEVAQELEGYLI